MLGLALLALVPWAAIALVMGVLGRKPRPLSGPHLSSDGGVPDVLIVVPARNEARNIGTCLTSLAAQEYPHYRIVVVDDRSTDGTGDVARAVDPGRSSGIEVLDGEPLPAGWFGKPWACLQGARSASEELILFTDADTRHAPELLASSVAALAEDGADAVTLIGDQLLGSFWERLLQPQIFGLLGLRFARLDRPFEPRDARNAIANGQYILATRKAYEAIGGHESVRGEVVEDLRLAQVLVGSGRRLSVRSARGVLQTRMYQALSEIVEGWSKNLAVGARQSAGRWGGLALPAIVVFETIVWIVPPVSLAAMLVAGAVQSDLQGSMAEGVAPAMIWAGGATLLGLLAWFRPYREFDVATAYLLLYPVAAIGVVAIALRSGLRGERIIEWKGRRYRSDLPGTAVESSEER